MGGGSNDIARNHSVKGMKNILEFVLNANHTNVIIMSAPHRHNLIRNSCVNKEVDAFNRKLCKRLKMFEKLKIIEVINERACYTKHGQHLNTGGKEIM
jgi:predicted AAA+ superfamily ATPase